MHDGRRLDTLRALQRLLDSRFRVPGTRFRFGWDPVIGLVPYAGDLIAAVMGGAILWHGHRVGVPRIVLVRMLLNVGVDVVIGVVPFVGDLADVFWKSHTRNMALLERHAGSAAASTRGDWMFLAVLVAALAGVALLALVVFYLVVSLVTSRGLV